MTPVVGAPSSAQRLLGCVFAASLASATVAAGAAVATALALPETWAAATAAFGAVVGAVLSSLIGSYALSWRAAALGAASGTALGVLPQPAWDGWGPAAGCWAAAALALLVVTRERPGDVHGATSPGLVAALHTLQLPLILFSLAVSLVSPRPRPFVVLFALSAFALWHLLDGECPLSRAEARLRALRGEAAPALDEIGFIGHQVHRATGILVPEGAIARLSYTAAALTFAWYAVQALL